MKRLILAAIAALLLVQPSIAQSAKAQEPPLCSGCPTASELKKLKEFHDKITPPAVAPQPAPTIAPPAPPSPLPVVAAAEPATQNTITTTAPVSSETTISVGTIAGQVLTWAAAAFGSLAATVFTAWGVRMFKLAGVQMGDAARARLQEIVVNGLNVASAEASKNLAGRGQVEIKNAAVAQAVVYAQTHGADAIKTLGLDPQSGAAVEAIKARIETAIADPAVPTPAVLDPVVPAKAA